MEKFFDGTESLEEKKKRLEDIADTANTLSKIPSPVGLSAIAASFSLAKELVEDGNIFLAAYYLSLCDYPMEGENNDDENDLF